MGRAQEMLEEQEHAGARGGRQGARRRLGLQAQRPPHQGGAPGHCARGWGPPPAALLFLVAVCAPPVHPSAMLTGADGVLHAGAGREGRQFGAAAGKQASAAFFALVAVLSTAWQRGMQICAVAPWPVTAGSQEHFGIARA